MERAFAASPFPLESTGTRGSDSVVRFLLASAPHADTFGYSMPPPGLLRLGGELARRGVPVELEDLAFRLAQGALPAGDGLGAAAVDWLLRDGPPDALGLSVMGATLPIALVIAGGVRARVPHARILLGGPGVTGVDRTVLERFDCVDVVARGEAERTLPELLERVAAERDFAGVEGTTWRRGDGAVVREPDRRAIEDLSELPAYAWELLPPLADYKAITGEREGLVPIDSGRGCVYDCSFCTIGRFWNRRSRTLPVERLVREVRAITGIPGGRNAYLCHDLFGADRRHALAVCDELERSEPPVPWECRARADHLDRELLERMRRAGCYRVLLGIESAAPDVRRRNQKGMRDDIDLLAVVDDCTAAGVAPILSLILGLPGEDDAALARSLDFCADAALRSGVQLSLHIVNPQPGCGLGEEHGAESRPVEGIPPDMARGTGESAAERALIRAHPELFSTFAVLPMEAPRLRELHAIASDLPEVLMRYPRTFALLRRSGERGAGVRDTLAVWRAWRATGRSFEAFAAGDGRRLVEEALRWEQAIVRAGARGEAEDAVAGAPAGAPDPDPDPEPDTAPRVRAQLLHVEHDLGRLTATLLGSPDARSVPREPVCLAVIPSERGVTTLRISSAAAALLAALEPSRTLSEHERRRPGIGRALETLAASGLVAFHSETAKDRPTRIALPHGGPLR